jgi:AcrR family transcriptional regulator
VLSQREILLAAQTAFNQQGAAFTLKQLTARLSLSPDQFYSYFNSKTELISQLVGFRLNNIRQMTDELPYHSLSTELSALLFAYQQTLAPFSRIALLDLKLHYPAEWDQIITIRENQWQKIAATLEVNIAGGRLHSIDISLLQNMVDGILQDPFCLETIWCSNTVLSELEKLVDIFLFGIAQPRSSFPISGKDIDSELI